jgi:hypothetical protein
MKFHYIGNQGAPVMAHPIEFQTLSTATSAKRNQYRSRQ